MSRINTTEKQLLKRKRSSEHSKVTKKQKTEVTPQDCPQLSTSTLKSITNEKHKNHLFRRIINTELTHELIKEFLPPSTALMYHCMVFPANVKQLHYTKRQHLLKHLTQFENDGPAAHQLILSVNTKVNDLNGQLFDANLLEFQEQLMQEINHQPKIAWWFIDHYLQDYESMDDLDRKFNNVLTSLATKDQTNALNLVFSRAKSLLEEDNFMQWKFNACNELLKTACEFGTTTILDWINKTVTISDCDIPAAIKLAMMHGQVPVLHWFNEAGLAKKYFTSDQFSIDFQAICAHDAYIPRKQNIQLAVVTFIHDNYCDMFNNFLNERNHQHLLSMFSCAASDGLLDIVTWLTDTFIKKMTAEEKTAVINYEGKLALMRAAENNHVHILEFLNRKFNCISELNNDPAYAFSTAALHGHLDSMKWLHTNFPMNNDHMCAFYESWNKTPIESLQKAGHVIGVQWMIDQNLAAGSRFNDHGFIDYRNDKKVILLNTFKRSRNIISGKDVRAIFEELLNDNLPAENQITVDDFLADNSSLLKKVLVATDDISLTKWVFDTFKLTAEHITLPTLTECIEKKADSNLHWLLKTKFPTLLVNMKLKKTVIDDLFFDAALFGCQQTLHLFIEQFNCQSTDMMRFIGQAYKGAAANDHFNILEELHKRYSDLYPQIKYIVDTKNYTADGLPYTYSEPVQRFLMLQDEAHAFDFYPNSSPLASDMESNLYDSDDSDLDAVLDCLAG